MRKAAGKRLPHGATTGLVLDALMRLGAVDGDGWVSRVAIVKAVRLPDTTVDDRLRVLVKRERVEKGERGKYRLPQPQQNAAPPQPRLPKVAKVKPPAPAPAPAPVPKVEPAKSEPPTGQPLNQLPPVLFDFEQAKLRNKGRARKPR